LEELLHQKELLSTPAERQRRLEEVPEIIPDTEYEEKETELGVAASNSSRENGGANTLNTFSFFWICFAFVRSKIPKLLHTRSNISPWKT